MKIPGREFFRKAVEAFKNVIHGSPMGATEYSRTLLSQTTTTLDEQMRDVRFSPTVGKLSVRERRMGAEVFAVKHKLGRAFFTRRLNKATRQRRLRSLTRDERGIAHAMGWL